MFFNAKKLKRNYEKNPIKNKKDIPPKEDLYYLYIELNLPNRYLEQILPAKTAWLTAWYKIYGIKKSNKMIAESSKLFYQENFGVNNASQLESTKIKRKKTCLEKYGVDSPAKSKEIKQKTKETMLKKYGVEYATQNKQIIEKRKENNLKKYGVENPSQLNEIKNKFKETMLQKYGVDNPLKSKEIKQKVKNTCLNKYGCEYTFQNEEIKEKAKNTCLEKYGVEYALQSKEIREKGKKTLIKKYNVDHNSKIKENRIKAINTMKERYGVEYAIQNEEIKEKRRQTNINKWGTSNISTKHIDPETLKILHDKDLFLKEIRDKNLTTAYQLADYFKISYEGILKILWELDLRNIVTSYTSKQETELQEMLPQFKKNKKILYPHEIDLFNEDFKLGIEFNGNYWHSDIHKDKLYHQNKSKLASKKGIFLYHIFEYEWNNKRQKPIIISQINNLIGLNNKIGARKCKIKEIDYSTCSKFLELNHIQGKDQSSIRYGLFHENELISVMTFCKPRFNKNYDWELSRFCSKMNTTVIGGANKLFKHFLNNYKGNIISYSNNAKTKGLIYEKLGFTFLNLSKPNYVWCKGNDIFSRYQTQKHLLKDYSSFGNTENEIMHNLGYHKIYDCGNKVWILKRD